MTITIHDTRRCQLGEGPLWHPERNQLFWFDILGKSLLSRDGDTPLAWEFDEYVSAAGWIDRDTLMIASQSALLQFDIASGDHEVMVPLEADNAFTRSNDGRADPAGGFWIGTMGIDAEPGAGAIYRYYRGALEVLYPEITVSNSICFAPDGRSAYYSDTRTHRIMVQALDAEGWPEGTPEVFADLGDEGLNPDGSVVDSEGGLWNAQWGAGRVARYHPDGRFDRSIAVPGSQATCPAFGGADLQTLYVTSAAVGLQGADESQGATFETRPGVTGQAEFRVISG
ncbi:SMP-30/gluconolactonase/LRE family protein [Marinovum sp.]|uniref:SMP-30/gluconolactonase/LRE family protein n=1 Tax=Marinovum sp. TaxID=2024839 RepID=UPI002B26B1BB|nr:SMP-30/gluconolactonase/LRE family protein [Marinovum sp.]